MEACFHYVKKKKHNCDFYLTILTFFPHNCECVFHNDDFFSAYNCKCIYFNSEFSSLYLTILNKYVTILRNKIVRCKLKIARYKCTILAFIHNSVYISQY